MKPVEHLDLALKLLEERDMKYNQIWDCIIACRDDLNEEYKNDSDYIFTVNDMKEFLKWTIETYYIDEILKIDYNELLIEFLKQTDRNNNK